MQAMKAGKVPVQRTLEVRCTLRVHPTGLTYFGFMVYFTRSPHIQPSPRQIQGDAEFV